MKGSAHLAAQQAMASSPSKVFILWDELLLTLVNFPKSFLKELTFMTKELQTDNRGRRKSVRKQVTCYETTFVGRILVVKTHQGFWKKALLWALARQLPYELIDLRTKDLLPLPKLGHMRGFRFKQKELITQALSFGCSGLIGAVTRYGKSCLIRNTLRAWPGVQSIVILPGADLLRQCYNEMKEDLPDREIKLIGAGSSTKFQSEDITIVSMDSLHKIDPGPVRLVLIDEPHAIVSSSRIQHLPSFAYARKYGFGATLNGRYDGHDFLLEGLVGPVLANRGYTEAVAEGAISPIKVMMIRWPIGYTQGDRDKVYKSQLFENELIGRCARYLSDVVIPRDWQMLYFIKTEDQADFMADCIGRDISVAMAKKLTNKERAEMTDRVQKNHIKRVICSDIYVQGVTFHDVMVLVNCGGGGRSTSTIQKPGRLAEVRKGKSAGLMIDFLFTPASTGTSDAMSECQSPSMSEGMSAICRESNLRLTAYKEIGYDVHIVERNEIQTWFNNQNITPPS
jgi:superfamily II DNA or RNA helicase